MSIADDLERAMHDVHGGRTTTPNQRDQICNTIRRAAAFLRPGQDDGAKARELWVMIGAGEYNTIIRAITDALTAERARERTRCAGIVRSYDKDAPFSWIIDAIEAEEPA